MVRVQSLAVLAGWLVLSSTLSAQTVPARFRWQAGQVLTYRAEQATTESETVGGTKVESTLKLNQVKRWQVLGVDAAGIATLQQSLTALRIEKRSGTDAAVLFDSTNPDGSDKQMREQLSKYVGTPLATLRVDSQGKVVEVKESKHTPASRYENELPFAILLPINGLQPGTTWDRTYALTLEPPLGTGEKYPAAQKLTCKSIAGNLATIGVATTVQAPPEDQVPLAQFQPQGEVVFDLQAGCMRKAVLTIDKELKNQNGADSSYHFQSRYTEEYVSGN